MEVYGKVQSTKTGRPSFILYNKRAKGVMKMKKCKKILILVLCLLMVQIPVLTVSPAETVQAATVKSGLKKEKGKYYYYEKGKKVQNTWKTIKTKETGKPFPAVIISEKTVPLMQPEKAMENTMWR